MSPRADVLALDDDALASLANRGIVKRASREVADGRGPAVTDDAGTLTATFADGTLVVLPPSTVLEEARCSCPASGVCRHRVMLVLAYRAAGDDGGAGDPPAADEPAAAGDPGADAAAAGAAAWSPGAFTDAELEAHLGTRPLAAARRAQRAGYRARVRRATAADPIASVELASCTVRFLVARELGYARVDAARGERADAVALAVWACRTADASGDAAAVVELQVGGTGSAAGGSGAEPVLAVIEDLLADGVAATAPAAATAIAAVRRALEAVNLRWHVDLLDDLADQVDAYRTRSARYDPALAAAYAAEAIARHRSATGGGAALRVQVLGTEETAETPLRLLRLTGLGARVHGDESSRTVEVYLAHGEARVVLALRRRADAGGGAAPTAAELGRRKAGRARLSAIAAGNVVTESAVRAANRIVRIADSRVARTTVAPSGGRWDDLPPDLVVEDLEAEAARLAALPPSLVRARVVADTVRAVRVTAVEDLHFRPGTQQLVATIRAPHGTARLVASHSAATPGAIDALARALSGDTGEVRFVAGHLRRAGGGVDLEPTAVAAGSDVVVPAFAEASGEALGAGAPAPDDALAAAVSEALALTAELVHRGHRHLAPGWAARAGASAEVLRRTGLTAAAAAVDALAAAVRAGGTELVDRWADAHIRLLVTAEQL
ncbi:hypothetical protein DSM112329_02505 [Paraconexibacter sp. AEG42_29]|uniref:SWIM-type domain-containing protein n=1 Tax=Paraconexibacter sp. AEG42_29 TaxID=2997339 RepID=A0AAU7AVH5_9ACTN